MGTRFLGLDDLRLIKGISYSKSQIFRKIKAKTFPEPVRLGANRIAFVESEIDEWIMARVAERDRSDLPNTHATNGASPGD